MKVDLKADLREALVVWKKLQTDEEFVIPDLTEYLDAEAQERDEWEHATWLDVKFELHISKR